MFNWNSLAWLKNANLKWVNVSYNFQKIEFTQCFCFNPESLMFALTCWVRRCGVVSNTLQCESLAQISVVSGRQLVAKCKNHCLALNWFVVFDLCCGITYTPEELRKN